MTESNELPQTGEQGHAVAGRKSKQQLAQEEPGSFHLKGVIKAGTSGVCGDPNKCIIAMHLKFEQNLKVPQIGIQGMSFTNPETGMRYHGVETPPQFVQIQRELDRCSAVDGEGTEVLDHDVEYDFWVTPLNTKKMAPSRVSTPEERAERRAKELGSEFRQRDNVKRRNRASLTERRITG